MKKFFDYFLGAILALAGVMSLPYLAMAMHDLSDAVSGQVQPDIPRWHPYAGVGLFGSLFFGAFFMAFRLLRRASLPKPKAKPAP